MLRTAGRHRTSFRERVRCTAIVVGLVASSVAAGPLPVGAAACSPVTGAASCTATGHLTITAGTLSGTLSLESSPTLYWALVKTADAQWASASATPLTACNTIQGILTHCHGGTGPTLGVQNTTEAPSGWTLSGYLTANTLPNSATLAFNGTGSSTYGYSQRLQTTTAPFPPATPLSSCGYSRSCTIPTPVSTCSPNRDGCASLPSYPVTLSHTSATSQIDLYETTTNTGAGDICFVTPSPAAPGNTPTSPSAFYNLSLHANTTTQITAFTINLAINSGP